MKDNLFSDTITIKPLVYSKETADEITESGRCLITEVIEKAKELGYTITLNGELLNDER